MKPLIIFLAWIPIIMGGCLSGNSDAKEECYPVLQLPGRGPNDIPFEEQVTNLTHPAQWTWQASQDCGMTFWRLERGDGQVEWKTGSQVDFDPEEVAFYNFSLVLQEADHFVVKHSIGLQVEERNRWSVDDALPSGLDDFTVTAPVACCAAALYSEVVLSPPMARPPGDWLVVKDADGVTIGADEAVVRQGYGDGNAWAEDVAYGEWTFTVVRSDPQSPYFRTAFDLIVGVVPEYVGIYEPGAIVSPP